MICSLEVRAPAERRPVAGLDRTMNTNAPSRFGNRRSGLHRGEQLGLAAGGGRRTLVTFRKCLL